MNLVINGRLITRDTEGKGYYEHGAVAYEGSKIVEVGEESALRRKYPDAHCGGKLHHGSKVQISPGGICRCPGRRHHAGPHQRPHPHLFRSGERSVHRGQQPHQLL